MLNWKLSIVTLLSSGLSARAVGVGLEEEEEEERWCVLKESESSSACARAVAPRRGLCARV